MKLSLVAVTSVDGKLTRGDQSDIYSWTSVEDQQHFSQMIRDHSLIIMGRKTYEAAQGKIKLQAGKLRVVMTHHPEMYVEEAVPGQLEFTSSQPSELVSQLEERGYGD